MELIFKMETVTLSFAYSTYFEHIAHFYLLKNKMCRTSSDLHVCAKQRFNIFILSAEQIEMLHPTKDSQQPTASKAPAPIMPPYCKNRQSFCINVLNRIGILFAKAYLASCVLFSVAPKSHLAY